MMFNYESPCCNEKYLWLSLVFKYFDCKLKCESSTLYIIWRKITFDWMMYRINSYYSFKHSVARYSRKSMFTGNSSKRLRVKGIGKLNSTVIEYFTKSVTLQLRTSNCIQTQTFFWNKWLSDCRSRQTNKSPSIYC